MIISNFSFDLLSSVESKKPIAAGDIVSVQSDSGSKTLLLNISSGSLYEGVFIRTDSFYGTIKKIIPERNGKEQATIQVETASENIKPARFEAFSTLNILNISLLAELILTFLIFYLNFQHQSKWWSRITLFAIILASLIWITRNIFVGNLYTYSSVYNGSITILIILFALVFFYHQLKRPDNPFVYASPVFWIISAILIYKAGTFFLFLYGNTLDQSEKENFFIINSFFYIVENVLFAVAFLIRTKKLSHKKIDR